MQVLMEMQILPPGMQHRKKPKCTPAGVTNSNRRVRTRMHGGEAGVGE